MLRRFVVTYEYTETVRGEPREFDHETMIEAANENAAHVVALQHFEELASLSSVGWTRVLNRCGIVAARRGAVAEGGKRVSRDRELAE